MNKKFYKYINTLFVVTPMTFMMALVAVARNHGFENGWLTVFFRGWLAMLPVAYIFAFVIIPFARKLTERLIK